MGSALASTLAVVLGCQSTSMSTSVPPDPSPSAVPAPSQEAEREAAAAAPGCTPLVEAEVAAGEFARGQAKVGESREGEHLHSSPFESGVDMLRIAAANGNLKAQSLYGRALFGARFSGGAPTPEQKDDYVSAIAFLRVAAKAGDLDAEGYLPGLMLDPAELPMPPLDSLPAGWVAEAFGQADAWIECYGLPTPG